MNRREVRRGPRVQDHNVRSQLVEALLADQRIGGVAGDGANAPFARALELGERLERARDHVHCRAGTQQSLCDATAKAAAPTDHQCALSRKLGHGCLLIDTEWTRKRIRARWYMPPSRARRQQ